ncbi:MAG: glycosyltransferase family 47 protein [Kiritimatiellales bacterium]|nr:glycosyltransferase family 47 protein [Kiritimatiellales bacterium]
MLKVYIQKIAGIPHIPLLYPNLGRPKAEGRMDFLNEAFDNLSEKLVEVIEDPAKADYILIPHNFPLVKEKGSYLQMITDLCEDHGKRAIVFWHGDSDLEVPIPNAIVFRTSQYGYQKRDNEIMMPPYTPDLLKGQSFRPRHKAEVPVVGFCGWAKYKNLKNHVGTIVKDLLIDLKRITTLKLHLSVHKKGISFRMRALKLFDNSSIVASNFILRDSYSGSSHTITIDPEEGRKEYIDNMLNSDFPLAIKGDGNYSYRFYEALSLGRVPVLVNTDCVLPLSDKINYSEFVCIVDHKDIRNMDQKIREFYDSLDEEAFVTMQKKAREAFETKLNVKSFLEYAVNNLL